MEGDVTEFRDAWEEYAVKAAARATCEKSKRGVIIVNPFKDEPLSFGWNGPPAPFECAGSDFCREVCNQVAVHAEARALMSAIPPVKGRDLVHIKVVEGRAVPSGGPSCWQCSRLIVEAGIRNVWLKHEAEGWRPYSAEEFHRKTLENCNLVQKFCEDCGCEKARHFGGLERHKVGCEFFPL